MLENSDVMFKAGATMLLTLLFTSTAAADTAAEEDFICKTCITVNTTCYNTTFLFDLEAPFRNDIVITKLGILHSTNTLYFSFEPIFTDPEYYKVGFVNLDNPDNTTIISGGKHNIMNFGVFDIDQDNAIVYLGGSDGIYVIDTKTKRVSPFGSRGDTILSIFYKGHVYFVRDGENKIVRKKADYFDFLIDSMHVKNFVINKYNVIIFLTNRGLYAQRNKEVVRLSKNAFIRGLTIDLDDAVYAWWIDGIYKVVIENVFSKSRLVKVADIPEIGALTFDNNNNFLFSSGKGLFKLVETNNTFC